MRRVLIVSVIAAAVGGLGSGTASANCDPKYRPLCMNDCNSEPPDLHDPLEWFGRTCPD